MDVDDFEKRVRDRAEGMMKMGMKVDVVSRMIARRILKHEAI